MHGPEKVEMKMDVGYCFTVNREIVINGDTGKVI
jgi:hypothetical protein